MPLVEITHARDIAEPVLRRLAEVLPHLVSVAVECPEEPYDGDLQPGDVDLRFRERSRWDRGGLDVVIEIRSKWFESRAANRQERVDQLHAALTEATETAEAGELPEFGVYLSLPVAAWSQGE